MSMQMSYEAAATKCQVQFCVSPYFASTLWWVISRPRMYRCLTPISERKEVRSFDRMVRSVYGLHEGI